jgi:hypothetical protein
MSLSIDRQWVDHNRQEPSSFNKNVESYLKTTSGLSKVIQLIQKPLKLVNHLRAQAGQPASEVGVRVEKDLSTALSVMSLGRIRDVSANAKEAIAVIDDLDGMTVARKISRTVTALFDAFTTYCAFFTFVRPASSVGGLVRAVDLTSDLATIPVDYSDWRQAARLENQAQGEVKEAISLSRKYYMLSVAKDVVSIAGSVLGLAFLSVLSIPKLILLSLSGTVIAISKDFLKMGGKYPVISFDRGASL